MTTVTDVPANLGTYMLRGWILTDDICPQCRKVPLLRSPSASRHPVPPFCVSCSPGSAGPVDTQSLTFNSPKRTSRSSVSTSDSAGRTSNSTAPTEVSSQQGSPELIPVDTPEAIRRRQQSDAAASEIGKRLLKGWAMLADECPGATCYGVPLVRPPKTGGDKDPRQECVICGTVYVDQVDDMGVSYLTPLEAVVRHEPITSSHDAEHSRSFPGYQTHPDVPAAVVGLSDKPVPRRMYQTSEQPASTIVGKQSTARHQGDSVTPIQLPPAPADQITLVLEGALLSLSQSLQFFSDIGNLDVTVVGQTAEAISKVTHALLAVKQLRREELRDQGL